MITAAVLRTKHASARWFRDHRRDLAIALALAVGLVVVLLFTEKQVGFTRDEGYYFKAARLYFGWFRDLWDHLGRGDLLGAFDDKVIDRHWKYNHEHPVLMKTVFGLSWGLGHEWLGWFDLGSTAYRFPTFVMAGLTLALVYALSRALKLSRAASLVAVALWVSMPRVFWHMHLAAFDIAVCAAHLWLVLAYVKGRRTPLGALVVGVAFGLAAAVKHNVLVTPAFFVLHWLLMEARGFGRGQAGLSIPPLPLAFFSMALIGPLVFVAHWPYLWPDVVKRIGWYLGFHLNHEHYPILWFGELLEKPPFPVSFPFVMSAVTIPLPVLLTLILGAGLALVVAGRSLLSRWRAARSERVVDKEERMTLVPLGDEAQDRPGSMPLLLLLNAAFPYALIALPSSPIFGGTKHWMNALPFLCVLGAWALAEGVARARVWLAGASAPKLRELAARPRFAVAALLVVGALCAVPGAWLSARVHPYGLAQYNSVVGFARGAATVGFQRTFWGYEPREVLPLINERTAAPGRIAFGDTNRDDYAQYKADGLLRRDIVYTGSVSRADVASNQPQGEFKEEWLKVLNRYGVGGPDEVVHIEGVPLLTVTFQPE